jgi:hypothetical protein
MADTRLVISVLNAEGKNEYAIDGLWPEDWWDTTKHRELWEAYVIPAFQQLRQQAAYRAHGDDCKCRICSGEIDEPKIA